MPESKKLLSLYYYLLLTRTLETKIATICHSQNPLQPLIIGKGYLSTGQEAISVGAASALEEGDWLAPSHRDLGGMMVRGLTIKQILLQYFCKASSPSLGRDGNVHLGDVSKKILSFISHMGSIAPVGNGVAAAMVYQGKKNVVLSCWGDGASSQGVIHETLNYASVFKLPIVFVVNNNQYAISTPSQEQMAIENLSDRAAGYGIPGITIDGNKVTDVYDHVKKAVERARSGKGPSLVECKTLRMVGHGTHDPAAYVPKDLIEEWKKKDPIVWFQNDLKKKGILSDEHIKSTQDKIDKEIEEAVEFARNEPDPQPEDLLRVR